MHRRALPLFRIVQAQRKDTYLFCGARRMQFWWGRSSRRPNCLRVSVEASHARDSQVHRYRYRRRSAGDFHGTDCGASGQGVALPHALVTLLRERANPRIRTPHIRFRRNRRDTRTHGAPAAIGRQTQLPYLVIHSRPTASVLRFKLLAETASCGLGTHLAHHRFA